MVEYTLPESLIADKDFVAQLARILKMAQPLNAFLNFTVDEVS